MEYIFNAIVLFAVLAGQIPVFVGLGAFLSFIVFGGNLTDD